MYSTKMVIFYSEKQKSENCLVDSEKGLPYSIFIENRRSPVAQLCNTGLELLGLAKNSDAYCMSQEEEEEQQQQQHEQQQLLIS